MKTQILKTVLMMTALIAIGCSEAPRGSEQQKVSASNMTAAEASRILSAENTIATYEFPTLHVIRTFRFEAPYGCNGNYEKSALFLSQYSQQRNSPELLFNGTCKNKLYIQASTAGDDFALIADLGDVPLEQISASKAFNFKGVVGHDNVFKENMPVRENHTYAVLISKSDIRALYVLKVDAIQNGKMLIRYAVKSYSVQKSVKEAPGVEEAPVFDWKMESFEL